MGQYYFPAILDNDGVVIWTARSFDYGSGSKLMEHSWLGGRFTAAVEVKLLHQPHRLVWAGDYADVKDGEKLIFSQCCELVQKEQEMKKAKESISTNNEGPPNSYIISFGSRANRAVKHDESHNYIVNHDKKEIVKLDSLPTTGYGEKVHALPLLTAEGNGRGGGDYEGMDEDKVGSWARDLISVETEATIDQYRTNGFTTIKVRFGADSDDDDIDFESSDDDECDGVGSEEVTMVDPKKDADGTESK